MNFCSNAILLLVVSVVAIAQDRMPAIPADKRPEAIAALAGVLRGHPDPVARELLTGQAEGDDRDSALEAVDALAALHDPAAATRLERLLTRASSQADSGLRRRLVAALGELRASAAPLLGRLEDDPDPKVRAEAAWALGKRADATSEPALTRALSSASAAVRANAAGALYRLGRAPAQLVRLADDRDPAARANAALALGWKPSPAARVVLERLRASDEDRHVRAAATLALARGSAPAVSDRSDWIAIHLVDFDGAPLADARYYLVLPDGLLKAGFADARGTAREESVSIGTCEIELPDDLPPVGK